ncbi:hypothetical protein E2C01_095581 [Portunus trituberculatus]|uniref:Uncharacterized protein n=1 Tax=Portunus trituberculatus TaxID=210409 RepID=A0A5B7K4K1_PORTR|nr:hypothetical protein [Portunus trituberculatus]
MYGGFSVTPPPPPPPPPYHRPTKTIDPPRCVSLITHCPWRELREGREGVECGMWYGCVVMRVVVVEGWWLRWWWWWWWWW